MGVPIFKIFSLFGLVSSWAEKALEDNKISIQETVNLAEEASVILGVPLQVDLAPTRDKEPLSGDEEVVAVETLKDDQPERYSHLKDSETNEDAIPSVDTEKDEPGR